MTVEAEYPLTRVRTLHAIDAARWTGKDDSAFWCEWDHPGETPRSFQSIVGSLEAMNWPRFIKAGSTCIDIGAHSGDTAVPLALFSFDKSSMKTGCVLCVEPNPDVYGVLEINVALNKHLGDFRTCRAAITEADVDEIELADHGNANCNGGILQGGYSVALDKTLQSMATTRYTAQGMTLSSLLTKFLDDEQQRNVTFIKTDCEGYDKQIIRSSREYLAARRPHLFIEWFAWFTPEDDDDLFAAVNEVDYVALDPRNLAPVDRTQRLPDLLCVHKTRAAEV
jgi:FkbM family methyltransferase